MKEEMCRLEDNDPWGKRIHSILSPVIATHTRRVSTDGAASVEDKGGNGQRRSGQNGTNRFKWARAVSRLRKDEARMTKGGAAR